MVAYEGIFFDEDEINKIKSYELRFLGKIHNKMHCTFVYKPQNEDLFDELLNKEISINLISYGYDNNNSGFEVLIPEYYMKYYKHYDRNGDIVKPHITSSISNKGKSKNTRYLKFTPLKEQVKITGRFGYWIIDDNGKEYLSFKPQKKTF